MLKQNASPIRCVVVAAAVNKVVQGVRRREGRKGRGADVAKMRRVE